MVWWDKIDHKKAQALMKKKAHECAKWRNKLVSFTASMSIARVGVFWALDWACWGQSKYWWCLANRMLTYEHGYDHVGTLAPDRPLNFVLDTVGLDTEWVWCQTFLEGIRSKMTCHHFDTFQWLFWLECVCAIGHWKCGMTHYFPFFVLICGFGK
jgi:hypothetical protein